MFGNPSPSRKDFLADSAEGYGPDGVPMCVPDSSADELNSNYAGRSR